MMILNVAVGIVLRDIVEAAAIEADLYRRLLIIAEYGPAGR